MYAKRGYSKNEVRDMGFPTGAYSFPEDEGSFTGTLVMKKWNNRRGLICYFDTDDGAKYKLIVWFSYDNDRTYCPLKSKVSLLFVDLGSRLKVTYGQTRNGKSKWLDAEVLDPA